jgi:hypothetical protein
VATDRYGPITDAEAASLGAAHALFAKASSVIAEINDRLDALVPGLGGRLQSRAAGDLLGAAEAAFSSTGEFTGFAGPLVYGLVARDGSAYWVVAVRPHWPSPDVATRIHEAADAAGLDADWARPSAGPALLEARIRVASLASHEAAVTWLAARIEELGTAGILAAALG